MAQRQLRQFPNLNQLLIAATDIVVSDFTYIDDDDDDDGDTGPEYVT
jgi:hypothetical protein